ncbi:MAG: MBL fold metallo-hydrolase [Terriglobia bacterium]|jgi:glyoxylase-like metal-dependent hydrolase (beta-lactamase superfamily II)
MQLGEFELLAISDGTFALDGGQMFGVVPKPLWERKAPADERNRIQLSLTCLLIRAGRLNILVETGIGDKFDAKFRDIYDVRHPPTLPASLENVGVKPEDVHIVINTHLHFDHCGWNTRRLGGKTVPTFPHARYLIQRGEWESALDPSERERASYIEEFFRAAEAQTDFLDGDTEVAPGVRVEVVPGHTRHLQCVRIESEDECAYFISDTVPMAAHLAYPWIMSFDLYPMQTLASKKRLLPDLARQQAIVIFPHEMSAPWLRLVEREGKITGEPVT